MAASRARRGPHGPRSVGEKPRVPARPVPSGKGDARPIGLGLGRKTRDPTGPTRSGGSGKRTPLPGRASGPPAPPPRSRPSPVPREGKTSRPSPQTPRQEAADAAPHFTFCSFNFGGGTLAASLAPDCSAPSGAAEALLAPPGSPAGPRSRAPPLRSPLPSPPSTNRGREPSRRRLYLLLLMRAEGASSARASVRWLRRRPSSGCTQSGSAGPAAAAARPGAALGLAVPRRSSRRGGRRGASVRWAGRHCRSPSGRGRAASEKAPPGACAPVSARDPRGPPARTSRRPGPPTGTRTPLAAARARPSVPPGAGPSRTHQPVTRAVREHARAGRAPRSLPFLRRPCLRLPRARGGRARGGQRRHPVGAKTCRAERLWEDWPQRASGGGALVAGREPGPRGPCESTQDEPSFTLCREDEFMTFGGHPERHGRNWLKDG